MPNQISAMCEFARIINKINTFNIAAQKLFRLILMERMSIETIIFLQINTLIRIINDYLIDCFCQYKSSVKQLNFAAKIFARPTSY